METREHLSGKGAELVMKDHEQRKKLEQVFPVCPPVLLPPKTILTQAQSGKSLSGPQKGETGALFVQETGEGGGDTGMLLESSVI